MRHIQIGEPENDHHPVVLSDAEAAGLAKSGLVRVQPTGNGMWQLSPRGLVGAAEVGDVLLDVRPKYKVGVSQLIFLLGYARNWASVRTMWRVCKQRTCGQRSPSPLPVKPNGHWPGESFTATLPWMKRSEPFVDASG